jgi:hypothetical protein
MRRTRERIHCSAKLPRRRSQPKCYVASTMCPITEAEPMSSWAIRLAFTGACWVVSICGAMVSAATAQEPKVARRTGPPRIEHVDTLHGLLVRDPYRWLEAADSPAVRAWVRHQDSATRQRLAEYPGRAELRARVAGIARAESFNPAPRREGGRYFITRVSSFGPQSGLGLVVRDSATGATTLLLDRMADGVCSLRGHARGSRRYGAWDLSIRGQRELGAR